MLFHKGSFLSPPPAPTESFHLLGERRGSLWMRGKPIMGQSPALRPRKRPLGEEPQGEVAGGRAGQQGGLPRSRTATESRTQELIVQKEREMGGGGRGVGVERKEKRKKPREEEEMDQVGTRRLLVTANCKDTPPSPTQQRQRQQGLTPPSPPTISLLLALLEYRRWQTAKTEGQDFTFCWTHGAQSRAEGKVLNYWAFKPPKQSIPTSTGMIHSHNDQTEAP